MGRIGHAWILALGAVACTTAEVDEPAFSPAFVVSDDAVVWQGLDHQWLYNHRWGRLGSGFVRAHPDVPESAYPLHGEIWEPAVPADADAWMYLGSAGAGTGKDLGTHRVQGTRIADAGVRFASLTAHHRIRHAEGDVYTRDWVVSAPLPEELADADALEVVLDGFWLDAVNEEAKQPFRFALDVGTAEVSDGTFRATVRLELGADCDTPECDGCFTKGTRAISDDVEYDVYVDLLVIAGSDDAFASERFDGPEAAEVWDGPPELEGPDACLGKGDRADCLTYWVTCGDPVLAGYEELGADAGRLDVSHALASPMPVGTLGVTGFELTLDTAHHMIAFDATATGIQWNALGGTLEFRQNLRFENWRRSMNEHGQDADVLSLTSYGVEGSYEGSMRWAALGFADATLTSADAEHLIITEATQLVVAPAGG